MAAEKKFNMRIVKKQREDGTWELYGEEDGKVWALYYGDFCGPVTDEYKTLIPPKEYAGNYL